MKNINFDNYYSSFKNSNKSINDNKTLFPKTFFNNLKNYYLPFNIYLPLQPKTNDQDPKNINNMIKEEVFMMNSSIFINKKHNNSSFNDSISSLYNVNSKNKSYFKEIFESFKEKNLNNRTNLDFDLNESYFSNDNTKYFNNFSTPKNNKYSKNSNMSSPILNTSQQEKSNNSFFKSYIGKLNYDNNNNSKKNLSKSRHARNKNNSINFKDNSELINSNLSYSSVKSPNFKKAKSHSIKNFSLFIDSKNILKNINVCNNISNRNKYSEFSREHLKYYDNHNDFKNKIIFENTSIEIVDNQSSTLNDERKYNNSNKFAINYDIDDDKIKIINDDMNIYSIDRKYQEKIIKDKIQNISLKIGNMNENYSNHIDEKTNDNIDYKNKSNIFEKNLINEKDKYCKNNIAYKDINSIGNEKSHEGKFSYISPENYDYKEMKKINYKKNLIYLISFLDNKIQKQKSYALNRFFHFTEELRKLNIKYGIKILFRLIKKKILFLFLKLFSRSKKFEYFNYF